VGVALSFVVEKFNPLRWCEWQEECLHDLPVRPERATCFNIFVAALARKGFFYIVKTSESFRQGTNVASRHAAHCSFSS
jgi:hypothetical protein